MNEKEKVIRMKTWPVVMMLLLSMLILPSCLTAQIDRGAIKGVIQDTQSASVPGAHLTLKNEATGVVANSTSGSLGQFNFLSIPAGVYTLSSEAKVFSTSVQQHIVVGVGSTVALNVTLQPGEVQQNVTVSAALAGVEAQTSDIGTVIT